MSAAAPAASGTDPPAGLAEPAQRAAVADWPLRRVVALTVLGLVIFSLAAVGGGSAVLVNLAGARHRLVDLTDPAVFWTQQLDESLLNQETGVRGYALGARPSFLGPWNTGLAAERQAAARLRALTSDLPAPAAADLAGVTSQALAWRTSYALPLIGQVRASGRAAAEPRAAKGKAEFNMVRARVAALQAALARDRRSGVARLNDAITLLTGVFVGLAAGLFITVAALAVVLRRAVIRPLHRLSAEVRQVAGGDFGHEVSQAGPREVTDLAADVNTMRASLEARARELQRSNAELEQFAYVASHDLQEPLRKVTSFAQLLQRRYGGQLDERADQYIEFAVDGAMRMQTLINDLLAFSRVGRAGQQLVPVPCAAALAEAERNLASMITESGAVIRHGELPTVLAQPRLLAAVFQNLLGNALKFRADRTPEIVIAAHREGSCWVLSVTDNGIGIAPEYADRIFVIFQRLHDRQAYPGTGIGLALCRKIIEYFGGKIWLDTNVRPGARFCFTLPVLCGDDVPIPSGEEEAHAGSHRHPPA